MIKNKLTIASSYVFIHYSSGRDDSSDEMYQRTGTGSGPGTFSVE